eukprot:764651-Hanusia_phi.AAC.4
MSLLSNDVIEQCLLSCLGSCETLAALQFSWISYLYSVEVNTPKGGVAHTPEEAEQVIKAQVLAGGRGLGTFKNGCTSSGHSEKRLHILRFKGGVHVGVKTAGEIKEMASKMLGRSWSTACNEANWSGGAYLQHGALRKKLFSDVQ